jgi:dipeptidyl aminopeptidase/acylaminoacyl peptidase
MDLLPIAMTVVAFVVVGCGTAPTATQGAPLGSPVDSQTPTPAAVAASPSPAMGSPRTAAASPAPPFGLAANGPVIYSENGDIYARDLETGTITLLVGGPEVDVGPFFSPDGSRFAFVRVTSEAPAMIAIMVADADGSNVHMVVEPEVEGDRHWWDWSPDSHMLVIQNSADGVPPLSVVDVTGTPQRRAIAVALEVHQVAWRLGGEELIFLGRDPEAGTSPRGLYAVGIDGTGLRELVAPPTSGTLAGGAFSLSHDGHFLAYTTVSPSGHVSSHILDLGSGDTRSMGGGFNQAWPTFSPDGERLALVRYPSTGAAARAFIVSSAGDGTDAVAMGPEMPNRPGTRGLQIQFSPDGTKLLIVHAAGEGAWVADVATGAYESVAVGDDQWVSWQRLAP